MPERTAPIARIHLARSLPRMLALPLVGLLAGTAAIAAGIVLVTGPFGIALAVAGALVVVLALGSAAILLSIRVDVEEAAVRVSWLGGDRVYHLVPGPVTRVRLEGEGASSLRQRLRIPGWQLGVARLRDEEDVEIVRLAPTPTAILVPTDRGRLAIAARDEEQLLDALSRAAQARQRLEEAAPEEAPPGAGRRGRAGLHDRHRAGAPRSRLAEEREAGAAIPAPIEPEPTPVPEIAERGASGAR